MHIPTKRFFFYEPMSSCFGEKRESLKTFGSDFSMFRIDSREKLTHSSWKLFIYSFSANIKKQARGTDKVEP